MAKNMHKQQCRNMMRVHFYHAKGERGCGTRLNLVLRRKSWPRRLNFLRRIA